ncbi:MAG: DUF3990 domain-containing protein [Prevotella sp.]|nr:DUF3990 domain-containing protein [Prevotella sp.]
MRMLFHGGTSVVINPICAVGRDNLDFGKGFYLTDMRMQAVDWATRIANMGLPQWLNVYEFDDARAAAFRQKVFQTYDVEWLQFIAKSRKGMKPWAEFDLIEGGIADDRVIDTVELYLNGDITEEMALRRLSMHQPNNQICILNQGVVNQCLRFVNSEPLNSLAK